MSTPLRLDDPSDAGTSLTRILPGTPPFSEEHLQSLLAAHPRMLPVKTIAPKHAPLIPLGSEVSSEAGPLDLLYISPTGHLTIAETKLWKNPEARRTVVAQILDYAASLATWDYEELDDAVRRSSTDRRGIWARVEPRTDLSEAEFIDAVQQCLQRGAFLLLIAGDGIRERAETLTKYVQMPHLHFSLHLVALTLYRLAPEADWPLLVYPEVIARTTEIERAVVTVQAAGDAGPPVVHTEAPAPSSSSSERRSTLAPEQYYDELKASTSPETAAHVRELIEQLQGLGVVPRWGSSSVSMRFPDPQQEESTMFTVVVLKTSGQFYLGWLDAIEDYGYPEDVWKTYEEDVSTMTGAEPKDGGTAPHPVSAIAAPEPRKQFLELVDAFTGQLRSHAR